MLNANESYGEDKAGVGMGTAGSVIFRRSRTMCDGGEGTKADPQPHGEQRRFCPLSPGDRQVAVSGDLELSPWGWGVADILGLTGQP